MKPFSLASYFLGLTLGLYFKQANAFVPNDECLSATEIFVEEGATSLFPFNNAGSTTSVDGFICGDDVVENDVWFATQPISSMHLRVFGCGVLHFDTVFQATDEHCGGRILACDDDACAPSGASVLDFYVPMDHLRRIYIRIGGYNGQTGNGHFVVVSSITTTSTGTTSTGTTSTGTTSTGTTSTGTTSTGTTSTGTTSTGTTSTGTTSTGTTTTGTTSTGTTSTGTTSTATTSTGTTSTGTTSIGTTSTGTISTGTTTTATTSTGTTSTSYQDPLGGAFGGGLKDSKNDEILTPTITLVLVIGGVVAAVVLLIFGLFQLKKYWDKTSADFELKV